MCQGVQRYNYLKYILKLKKCVVFFHFCHSRLLNLRLSYLTFMCETSGVILCQSVRCALPVTNAKVRQLVMDHQPTLKEILESENSPKCNGIRQMVFQKQYRTTVLNSIDLHTPYRVLGETLRQRRRVSQPLTLIAKDKFSLKREQEQTPIV